MMSAKKNSVYLFFALLLLLGAVFIYLRISNRGPWFVQKPTSVSLEEGEKSDELPLIENLKDYVGKSQYVSFVNYQTNQGASDLGYILVKGYIYQINSEDREIVLAIDPDQNLYLKTSISPQAVWTNNAVSLSKDGFSLLQKNTYLTGACGDERCSFLNAVEIR